MGTDTVRLPDSVSWTLRTSPATSGYFHLTTASSDSFHVTDTFQYSIASDTLQMDAYTLGLHTTTAPTLVGANGNLTVLTELRRLDSAALKLLVAFDSARHKSLRYGADTDPLAKQIAALQDFVASQILSGAQAFGRLPMGVDTATVVNDLLGAASKAGQSIPLVSKLTGLDTTWLQTKAKALIQEGLLRSSDSTVLFPPYPVRVTTPISIGSVVVGGAAEPVQGAFAWTKGRNISISQLLVRSASRNDSMHFSFPVQRFSPKASDTSWDLTGNLSIQASDSAMAGMDTLVVSLSDDSGHSATVKVEFQVIARPHPVVSIPGLPRDSVVPYSISSFDLFVTAGDSTGIDSVKVNDIKMTSAPYRTLLQLVVGSNPITVDAWDKAGNHLASPLRRNILRQNASSDTGRSDKAGPTVTIVAPSSIQTVDFGTTSFVVRLKVSDPSGVDTVLMQGLKADTAQGEYRREIPLTAIGTPTSIAIHAVDMLGNRTDVIAFVTRSNPPDSSTPTLTLLWPRTRTGGMIQMDSSSVLVSWRVVDVFGIATNGVLINGIAAEKGADSIWSLSVPIAPTGRPVMIPVVVTNTKGSHAHDTVWVARQRDTVLPRATLLPGLQKTMTIDDSITSLKVGWDISDNYKMGVVTINQDTVVPGVKGEYSVTIKDLPLGPTTVCLKANDSSGNSAFDTLTVTRVPGASPVLSISHAEGVYDSILHISLTSSVSDAVLKYTLDGTDPSPTNGLTYSIGGTILISQSKVLKVNATATGHNSAAIQSRTYTLSVDPITFSVPSGTTTDSMFTVALSSATSGVTFYYTTDGSTPKVGLSASTTSGILIDSIRTVKAIATKSGWANSTLATCTFRANIPVAVFVGNGGSKVIRADGSLWTTGVAATLGDGSATDRSEFVKVMEGVRAVNGSMILTTAGDVFSYGGSFGSTTTTNNPIASGIAKISAASDPSAMLVDIKGGLFALGQNDVGQLCTGDSVNLLTPKPVASGVKDVGVACTSARGLSYCRTIYVTSSGSAYGCGNYIGATQTNAALPTQIPGSGYSSVSVYGQFFEGAWWSRSSLLTANGELFDLVESATSPPTWTSVRTGVQKTVVAGISLYSLEAYGWIYVLNEGGSPATDWTQVSNLIHDIASNGGTNLYIKTDGTLWASGNNGGLYGDGTTTNAGSLKRIHLPN